MKRKLIAGGVVVVLAAIWLFSSLDDPLTPYVSFEDAMTRDQRVQVIGAIVWDAVSYDADSLRLMFQVEDESGQRLSVTYDGSMPGNFDQATKVVCIGVYRDGAFRADDLLLKCPSKYQGDS